MVVDGWRKCNIGDIASAFTGFAFKSSDFMDGDGIPVIRMSNLKSGVLDFNDVKRVSPNSVANLSKFLLEDGDFLFGMSGSLSNFAVVKRKNLPCYLNQRVGKLVAKNVEYNFLKYLYLSETVQNKIDLMSAGAAQKNISSKQIESIEINLPPLPEQKKIAEILISVDKAIAKTEAIIEQTLLVKQGLLQQFFHRGYWDKKKPIPYDYKSTLLDEIAKRGSGHTPDKKHPEYWSGNIKWVSLQDTKKLDKLYITDTKAEISKEGIKNSSAVLHPAGVVVLSRDATLGKSAITSSEMAVSQHFISWECGPNLDKYYFYYWLQLMKPIFELVGVGSTIKTIGLGFFKKLQIPIPPIKYQKSTALKLKEIDEYLFSQEKYKRKIILLKKGLMSDLLTGRVRVNTPQAKDKAA